MQNTILIDFVLVTSCRWFAKRFLHPDVVSVYDYIFLWDEDLGVENFHPGRYHYYHYYKLAALCTVSDIVL